MGSRVSGTGLALLLAAVLIACGASPESPTGSVANAPLLPALRGATLEALLGPWQSVPYRLDKGMRNRAEVACRTDMHAPPGPVFSTMDARGGGVIIVRVRGADMAVCNALQITPTGDIVGAGSGSTRPWVEPPISGDFAVDLIEVAAIEGGQLQVQGWSVQGRAGPAIRLVMVQPAGGLVVVATVENGWFAAWWPAPLPVDDGGARDASGVHFTIQGYDASHLLRAQYTQ